jgi:hemoglobin-like flavoprotein
MDISESLEVILESREPFGKSFYEYFLLNNPTVVPFFEGIDMARQELVLTMALSTIVQHYLKDHASIDHYMRHLGTRHHRWNIPPDLYPVWCDSMLATLKKFLGKEWNDELAGEWRAALEKASHTLLKGYDRHVGI